MRENEKTPAESPTERLLAEIREFRKTTMLNSISTLLQAIALCGIIWQNRQVNGLVAEAIKTFFEFLLK